MSRRIVRIVLSIVLLGVSATAANAAVRYGRATNTWSNTATWSATGCTGATGASVPAAGDDVIICAGYTVTLNANSANLNTLSILGTLLIGNNTTARTLTVAGNLTNNGTLRYDTAAAHVISVGGALNNNNLLTSAAVAGAKTLTVTGLITNAGTFRYAGTAALTVNANGGISNSGTFDVNTASNVTHALNVGGGDIDNSGTFNLATDSDSLCNTTFSRNGNQTVSGAGATTRFNRITLNMGTTNTNKLDITATNFSINPAAPTGFLTLTNGTFQFSTTGTITPFTAAAAPVISATRGFWLNNAGATVQQTSNFDWTVSGTSDTARGLLRVSSGTLDIRNSITPSPNNDLFTNNFSNIVFEETGGAGTTNINIGGALRTGAAANNVRFNMSGGTLTVAAAGAPTTDPFRMESGASFTMSGGTIVVRRDDGGNGGYWNLAGTANVTGGTLQIGDASTPAGQIMEINSTAPVWNLTVNNTNSPTARLATNNLTVKRAVTIGSGGNGALNANNLNITVGVTSGGGSGWTNNGTFTPGTGTVTFNDNAAQGITGATTFYHLIVNNAAGVTANSNLTVNGNFTNTAGFNAGTTLTTFSGTALQTLTGATTFYDLTFNNTAGFTLNNDMTASNALTLTSGVIATGVANALIFSSTATCSVTRTSGRVNGWMRKSFTLSQKVCDFEIGDNANYTPVNVDFSTAVTFTGGTVTAKATATVPATDHPEIATAPLDANNLVNRYWMLMPGGGLAFDDTVLTFTPIGGSPVDHDSTANVGSYKIQRWEVSSGSCDPADAGYTAGAGSWNNTNEACGTCLSQTTTRIMAGDIGTFGGICSHFVSGVSSIAGFQREKEFIYQRELYY